MSCCVGGRCDSDPMLLWLWCRPEAVAPIWPLAWGTSICHRCALKSGEKKKSLYLAFILEGYFKDVPLSSGIYSFQQEFSSYSGGSSAMWCIIFFLWLLSKTSPYFIYLFICLFVCLFIYLFSDQQQHIQAVAVTYTTAHGNIGSLTHWVRPGIEPTSSWMLIRFVSAEPWQELQKSSPYFSFQQFDYDMPMCVFIYTFAAWGSPNFLNL